MNVDVRIADIAHGQRAEDTAAEDAGGAKPAEGPSECRARSRPRRGYAEVERYDFARRELDAAVPHDMTALGDLDLVVACRDRSQIALGRCSVDDDHRIRIAKDHEPRGRGLRS